MLICYRAHRYLCLGLEHINGNHFLVCSFLEYEEEGAFSFVLCETYLNGLVFLFYETVS